MSRYAVPVVFCLLLSVSAIGAESHVPKANTRAAVKAYVEAAAKYVAQHGPSCSTLADKAWASGDYYVFVVGPDDKLVCHPKLAGKATSEVLDSNGKHVGELLSEAGRKGGGWVDYVWPRPGTTNPVAKSSYATSVKGPDGKMYVVGAGGYELK